MIWCETIVISGPRKEWKAKIAARQRYLEGTRATFTPNELRKLFARVGVSDELLEDAPRLDKYLRIKVPDLGEALRG